MCWQAGLFEVRLVSLWVDVFIATTGTATGRVFLLLLDEVKAELIPCALWVETDIGAMIWLSRRQ